MSQYHWVVNLDKKEFLNGLDVGRVHSSSRRLGQ
jgi:hypothetical protein